MATITPDELLLLLGSKEAEVFLLRRQAAALAAERDAHREAAATADAEVGRLRALLASQVGGTG